MQLVVSAEDECKHAIMAALAHPTADVLAAAAVM